MLENARLVQLRLPHDTPLEEYEDWVYTDREDGDERSPKTETDQQATMLHSQSTSQPPSAGDGGSENGLSLRQSVIVAVVLSGSLAISWALFGAALESVVSFHPDALVCLGNDSRGVSSR